MKLPLVVLLALANVCLAAKHPLDFFEVEVKDIQGQKFDLDPLLGKNVVLVANVASQCGHTQAGYQQLNELQTRFGERGLFVLGAPCNQFGGQEPGKPDEIQAFAAKQGGKVALLEKMDVNGGNTHEMYRFLKGEYHNDECENVRSDEQCEKHKAAGECESFEMLENCARTCDFCPEPYKFGGDIQWNFESFLISHLGDVVGRWATGTDLFSEPVISAIDIALSELHEFREYEGDDTYEEGELEQDEERDEL